MAIVFGHGLWNSVVGSSLSRDATFLEATRRAPSHSGVRHKDMTEFKAVGHMVRWKYIQRKTKT